MSVQAMLGAQQAVTCIIYALLGVFFCLGRSRRDEDGTYVGPDSSDVWRMEAGRMRTWSSYHLAKPSYSAPLQAGVTVCKDRLLCVRQCNQTSWLTCHHIGASASKSLRPGMAVLPFSKHLSHWLEDLSHHEHHPFESGATSVGCGTRLIG